MVTDTLSDVLRAAHLTGSMFFRVRARSPYAVGARGVREMIEDHAPGVQHMLPFHLVRQGQVWFDVDGSDSLLLGEGDIIVVPSGANHSLSDRPGSPATPVGELGHAIAGNPPTLYWGGDGETAEVLCGFFHCNGRLFNPLIAALPEVLVFRGGSADSVWLTTTLERAFTETLVDRPGRQAVIARLTELLFLEVVQRHLEDGASRGWLGALRDPLVGAVLDRFQRATRAGLDAGRGRA